MVLQVRKLVKRFGASTVLNDLTFEAARGSIHGIIGPNGAGKTTAMRILLRIVDADSGSILWDGRPLSDYPQTLVGYMPEERGLYPTMTVEEQVAFFGELGGLDRPRARQRTAWWLDRLQLTTQRGKRGHELSKGNARKAQFAIAAVTGAPLLVLDEPFEGLDPISVGLLKDVMRDLQQGGTTIVLSTHSLDVVEDLCQTVTLIDRGQAVLSGATATVRESRGWRTLQVRFKALRPEQAARLAQWEAEHQMALWRISADGTRSYRVTASIPADAILSALQPMGDLTLFVLGPPSLEEVYADSVSTWEGGRLGGAEPLASRAP